MDIRATLPALLPHRVQAMRSVQAAERLADAREETARRTILAQMETALRLAPDHRGQLLNLLV
jgi:hypothetical protein